MATRTKIEVKTTEDVIEELNKEYGRGSIIHGGQMETYTDVIRTGSLSLDKATGIGGIPLGKVIEIYGWEGTGKSTLVQSIIGNAQKQGIMSLLVDGENSLDETYAKNLGVDLDKLIIMQLDEHAGDGAYNKTERLVRAGEIKLVVYDSYNSLQPLSVLVEGEVGEAAIGKHARLMGQAVQKANYLAKKFDCTFIFVGQMREKIGVIHGNPSVTQGGNALKFYTHMRMAISSTGVTDGTEVVANRTKVKIIKNRLAVPFKTAEYDVRFGIGIDHTAEILNVAQDLGVIVRSGSYYSFDGTNIAQGIEATSRMIADNPELETMIMDKLTPLIYGE